MWVDAEDALLSVSQQCELLGLSRSSYYYEPATESAANLALMAQIDREYTAHPFRGSRGMTAWLRRQGQTINRKRVQRLMRLMGLEAVYPKPRLSVGGAGHKVFPYLLRNVAIERVNQVWSTDITYIPMPNGFMYLTAVIDWYSRYVLSWKLSNTLDVAFCLEALDEALRRGCPEVFNTDQGVQYTSASFTARVEAAGAQVSMDGRGRCLDNVFVERLWRTVKYEYVYLWRPEAVPALAAGLMTYFGYYDCVSHCTSFLFAGKIEGSLTWGRYRAPVVVPLDPLHEGLGGSSLQSFTMEYPGAASQRVFPWKFSALHLEP